MIGGSHSQINIRGQECWIGLYSHAGGGLLLRPVGEEQVGRNIASRRAWLADFSSIRGRTPSPGSETKAALGLSQGQALILVLVLSLVLYAAIWVTVALLSVAGGGELGRTVSR